MAKTVSEYVKKSADALRKTMPSEVPGVSYKSGFDVGYTLGQIHAYEDVFKHIALSDNDVPALAPKKGIKEILLHKAPTTKNIKELLLLADEYHVHTKSYSKEESAIAGFKRWLKAYGKEY
jgi:hypothetical protein